MKKYFAVAAVLVLAACGSQDAAEETPDATEDAAVVEAPVAAQSLNETSWSFEMDGQQMFESIDAEGNYIANADGAHADHGTYVKVDGLHCFTSAMTDEGQVCWTTPAQINVGDTVEVTSDQGTTLTITRAEYEPLTM